MDTRIIILLYVWLLLINTNTSSKTKTQKEHTIIEDEFIIDQTKEYLFESKKIYQKATHVSLKEKETDFLIFERIIREANWGAEYFCTIIPANTRIFKFVARKIDGYLKLVSYDNKQYMLFIE